MRLRLTLLDPARGREVEVVVEAAPGATLADLDDALAGGLSGPVGSGTWWADGTPVMPGARLGSPPLLDRARLRRGEGAGPGHDASGRDAVGPAAGGTDAERGGPLLQMHAVGGPDTGLVHDLRPGRHTIGRSPSATVRPADPSLSRVHAVLDVTSREVLACDGGSTNGTWLDGARLDGHPVPVAPGSELRIGDSRLVVRTPRWPSALVRPDHGGHLVVSRSPRLAPAAEQPPIAFPGPPADPTPARLPILPAVLPLVLSAGLAVAFRSPTMLLVGLLSPLLVLGQWASERRSGRRTSRAERTRYAAQLADAHVRLETALAAERAARDEEDPETAQLAVVAAGPLSRLWDRTGDERLTLRVGVGPMPARTRVTGADPPVVDPVPVLADLGTRGRIGVAGPPQLAGAAARAVVGQLVVRRSPGETRVTYAGRPPPQWGWLTRLPHWVECPSGPGVGEGPRRPEGPTAETVTGPHLRQRIVVVADHAVDVPVVDGVHVVVLAPSVAALPADVDVVLDLTRDRARLVTATATVCEDLHADLVPLHWAERLADRLAPLRDARAAVGVGGIPERVRLLDLLRDAAQLPVDGDDRPDLLRQWETRPRSTHLPVATTATGPLVLDLVADGPHVLVGGTTGSGKSELLISLVAALAALNRPDECAMVLVDYKGGAAFGRCLELPHVVGLVTDLDHALTERALASLRAELTRRERLLGALGAADLADYQHRRRAEDPVVGRLVIVVDELRALADELPDFVSGLVQVAALGRSLGVHLVVATQRPAGVVTADMRANLGLRIALRVRDAADSLDVLDSPVAAAIPGARPGRAFVRSGQTALTEVQTARVTTVVPDPSAPVQLLAVDGIPCAPSRLPGELTDLDALVTAAVDAARGLGCAAPRSPWLPPLPSTVRVAELPARDDEPGLPLGLADHPGDQEQRVWRWDPAVEGPLGIAGGARSGRSTTLRTLASIVASSRGTALYAVHTGALADLDAWRHVGAAVDVEDLPRLARLLDLLSRNPSPAKTPSALPQWPARMLLVDDVERVRESLDAARAGRLREQLDGLLRGRPGLAVCVTGGRAVLSGPGAAGLPRALMLLPADPVDLTVAGVHPRSVPVDPPRGRAIEVRSGVHVQLAIGEGCDRRWPGSDGARPGGGKATAAASDVERVAPLPLVVRRSALPAHHDLLVVATDGARAQGFCRSDRRIAVLGPRRSGRTSALLTLAEALALRGRAVVVVGDRPPVPGPERDAAAVTWLRTDEVDALIAARRARPDLAVLVDDAGQLSGTPVEPVLREILRLVDQDDGVISVSGTADDSVGGYRTLVAEVCAAGCGLLLGAVRAGEELALGLDRPPYSDDLPGRGHLVRAGSAVAVQVALPGPESDHCPRPEPESAAVDEGMSVLPS